MVGWFQAGWLCVIWKWNKSVCAWECGVDGEKYRSVVCGRDMVWRGAVGGVCCLLDVPEGCSYQVNIRQCTLEGVEVVVDKCIIH